MKLRLFGFVASYVKIAELIAVSIQIPEALPLVLRRLLALAFLVALPLMGALLIPSRTAPLLAWYPRMAHADKVLCNVLWIRQCILLA